MVFGVVAGAALAQEGHPLKGSWLGDFGPNKTTRTPVFLVMDWDGKNITGMLYPGTENIPIKNATLIPPTPPPAGAGRGGGGGNRGGGGGGNRGGGGGDAAAAGGGGGGAAGGGGRGGAAAGGAAAQATPPAAPPPAAVPAAPAAPPQPDWLFHFEADGKDRSGAAVKYVVDGKVENVGLANRNIVGTWMVGTTKNDFRVVRQ
jgi:hypothetical protein